MRMINRYRLMPLLAAAAIAAAAALWTPGCSKKSARAPAPETSEAADAPVAAVETRRAAGETPGAAPDSAFSLKLIAGTGGKATARPRKAAYRPGENIAVSAAPDSGYAFAGWTGGRGILEPYEASTDVVIRSNIAVAANFRRLEYGALTDARDKKTYKTVAIGGQRWMAENLNYQPANGESWCYGGDDANCGRFGRLYDWAAAMGLEDAGNGAAWGGVGFKHRGICPAGWHLPSWEEWSGMLNEVGGFTATALKSTSGWFDFNGTDTYGFSILPSGARFHNGKFSDTCDAYWWTSTERGANLAHYMGTAHNKLGIVGDKRNKRNGFSVRCADDGGDLPYSPKKASASDAANTLADARDGKKYKTAALGGQTWMAENLNYAPAKGNSWCYNDHADYCGAYGRLYDWETARTACPAGWHLPTVYEWGELTGWVNFVYGGDAAVRLAAASGWNKTRGRRTDDYGFTALSGGLRHPEDGFMNAGYTGSWWTDTEADGDRAYERSIRYDEDTVALYSMHKKTGYSVRCVMNESAAGAYALTLAASAGGTASAYPGKAQYRAGKRVTITAAPKSGYVFDKWTGGKTADAGSATTVVTMDSDITLTANFRPVAYGSLSDKRDGRTYKTAKMPDGMIWMAENLNYAPSSGNGWVYKNNTSYSDKYGRLYDWAAAKTVCPDGWRLPTRQDWNNLAKAAGGKQERDEDGNINWRGAGKALKASSGWGEKSTGLYKGSWNGADAYGFSALPGGYRCGAECSGGGDYGAGGDDSRNNDFGRWWTATTAENDDGKAFYRRIFLKSADMAENDTYKSDGNSVRCVAGGGEFAATETSATYSLTLKAANGGTVSADPVKTAYSAGEEVAISASPDCGFAFVKWTGGETADAASATTTVTVNSNMTVAAKFTRVTPHLAHGKFTDARDGKTYKTVQICKYVWMAENLNYKADGSRCYNDADSNCVKYGRLYDWAAAAKSCPSGWHLSSDKEWEALEGYADGWEKEISEWGIGGRRLKTKSGWSKYEDKSGGNGTDEFGFSAPPGGFYNPDKGFFQLGESGGWWAAAESRGGAGATLWYIPYTSNSVQTRPFGKDAGFSARCVNDKDGGVPPPAALTLKLTAGTGGTVSAEPSKASYVAGERVTISAVPNRGYAFAKWTGGKVADSNYAIAIVTVSSNTAITANFSKSKAPPAVYKAFTDTRDGKKYETVSIGGRAWMAQNLNYEAADSSWCYGDSAAGCAKYGRLYSWRAAKTACPAGWHLPTAEEWDALIKAAGGEKTAGNKLKAVFGWARFGNGWIRTGNGDDAYGFSALPGGSSSGGKFYDAGNYGYWWTATEDEKDAKRARRRKMDESDGKAGAGEWSGDLKSNGMSVRCVIDEAAPYTLALTAAPGGTASANPAKPSYKAGELVSITAVPDKGYIFAGWTGGKTANAAYAATTVAMKSDMAIAANFKKNDAPPATYGALADARDGKSYKTVVIGGKTWTAENLNYQTPKNSWCYDGKTDNCAKYGRLYEWETAKTVCPAGWHLPSRDEWKDLIAAAGGENAADKKLKSVFGWSRAGNGADVYGFSALPGGYRHHHGRRADNEFEDAGNEGYWWTSTDGEFISDMLGAFVGMASDSAKVFTDAYYKSAGLSARCVMDENGTLTLTAGTGGTASADPSKASYKAGEKVTITAVPNDGYAFVNWTGGSAANADAATTTVVVNANMTISANFRRVVSAAFSDARDGKTYKTVKIGRKTWMAENLNYRADSSWCYDNDSSYCDKYGRLYDWKAAQKACPRGWHLPSRAEWDSLATAAGGWCRNQAYNNDIGITWYEAGRKLKSKADWGRGGGKNSGGGTDSVGFSALPGGFREGGASKDKPGRFAFAGAVGFWWSSAQKISRGDGFYKPVTYKDSSKAFNRDMDNLSDNFGEHDRDKSHGYSVRCVADK